MCDRNAKSECILIKLCALVSESICERTTKFHEKILFDGGVINLQTPTTKFKISLFPIQHCLLQSFVQKWRCVVRTPFDILTIGDGVGCCEQSGAYRFVLHWSTYEGEPTERPVLSRCLASSTASASYLRLVWWLVYFSTGQHSTPQGAWDHAAVNLWNTRLHRFSSVASQ